MGSRLAALLEQATKGEWEAHDQGGEINIGTMVEWVASVDTSHDVPFDRAQCESDARLIALAPDMARLLVDMADYMERIKARGDLLARFAALDEKAGGA